MSSGRPKQEEATHHSTSGQQLQRYVSWPINGISTLTHPKYSQMPLSNEQRVALIREKINCFTTTMGKMRPIITEQQKIIANLAEIAQSSLTDSAMDHNDKAAANQAAKEAAMKRSEELQADLQRLYEDLRSRFPASAQRVFFANAVQMNGWLQNVTTLDEGDH